jgi:Ligated ion channel L-glutamate- and glycine-binding site
LHPQETPYVMMRGQGNLTGNHRYEGFCIDLLRMIASMVGFEYRIELVPDGKYGVYDLETGEWNGIVRQLMDKVCLHTYCQSTSHALYLAEKTSCRNHVFSFSTKIHHLFKFHIINVKFLKLLNKKKIHRELFFAVVFLGLK